MPRIAWFHECSLFQVDFAVVTITFVCVCVARAGSEDEWASKLTILTVLRFVRIARLIRLCTERKQLETAARQLISQNKRRYQVGKSEKLFMRNHILNLFYYLRLMVTIWIWLTSLKGSLQRGRALQTNCSLKWNYIHSGISVSPLPESLHYIAILFVIWQTSWMTNMVGNTKSTICVPKKPTISLSSTEQKLKGKNKPLLLWVFVDL